MISVFLCPLASHAAKAQERAGSAHRLVGSSRLSVKFEANVGQFAPETKYAIRGPRYNIFLTSSEFDFNVSIKVGADNSSTGLKGGWPMLLILRARPTQWVPRPSCSLRRAGTTNYRRFKSSLPDHLFLSRFFDSTNENLLIPSASCPSFAKNAKNGAPIEENG